MNTPPLLIGASLLFWGLQTGYLVVAIPMALVLEGSRFIKRRWDFSPRDFHRIADLCALIFLGMFVLRFAANTASMGRWIPIGFFPLLLAQALSTTSGVDLGALFYTMRKREKRGELKERRTADVSWPAFVLILIAASAANVRTPDFYTGLCVLSGWALVSIRPKRFHPVLWGVLLLTVGGLGWTGQHHLRKLHLIIEQAAIDWYMERMGLDRNPFRNVTAIGDVGKLKLSNRIVLRVRPEGDLPASRLLREAGYDLYSSGFWIASDAKFRSLSPEEDGRSWRVSEDIAVGPPIHVTARLNGEKSVLSLPMGAVFIDHLPVVRMEKNRFGTVRAHQVPTLARYRVFFDRGRSHDGPPDRHDLEIPEREAAAVQRVAKELQLHARSPGQVIAALNEYFGNRFTYSLTLKAGRRDLTPIEDFLLQSRSGHCELFATAGVFLMRASGVPARYATGYRIDEFSRLEGQYVVRARHAHAWVTAYVDGQWHDVDVTPPGWLLQEKEAAPWLEPVYDVFRWIGFQFSKWRHSGDEGPPLYLLWLILPLFLILVWRIVSEKRSSRVNQAASRRELQVSKPGKDSPFARIDVALSQKGFQRREWETQQTRLRRLEHAGADAKATARLEGILLLHYHIRFRPNEDPNTTEELSHAVDAWMTDYESGDQLFPAVREEQRPSD
ncbi:hypothetical protein D3OALGA1CA_212 [Olavius algarvensis associated proteobacterium Delta 3]|nr:hypothetical protein D3OALGA1CA_212 [Olavius algarvensis associated proteobacterium Delta 3]CAB5156588.1 hypothetical protein D3OALGB2SA_5145 [Olavius algarvensis associated proteobacterium Delta 3]